jgi:HD superfamily phosphodiesterase
MFGDLKDQLLAAMEKTFGEDRRRINHARAVLIWAERILKEEPADAATVTAAAILHDIGIQEAERKHGSSSARFQELEGPPIARPILDRLGFDPTRVDHVCRIVGAHHSAQGIDSLEFRIVWDADWLVNIPDEHGDPDSDGLRKLIARVFRTTTGKRLAEEAFLGDKGRDLQN